MFVIKITLAVLATIWFAIYISAFIRGSSSVSKIANIKWESADNTVQHMVMQHVFDKGVNEVLEHRALWWIRNAAFYSFWLVGGIWLNLVLNSNQYLLDLITSFWGV